MVLSRDTAGRVRPNLRREVISGPLLSRIRRDFAKNNGGKKRKLQTLLGNVHRLLTWAVVPQPCLRLLLSFGILSQRW